MSAPSFGGVTSAGRRHAHAPHEAHEAHEPSLAMAITEFYNAAL